MLLKEALGRLVEFSEESVNQLLSPEGAFAQSGHLVSLKAPHTRQVLGGLSKEINKRDAELFSFQRDLSAPTVFGSRGKTALLGRPVCLVSQQRSDLPGSIFFTDKNRI